MARLDKERQKELEPLRMRKALNEIKKLGYKVSNSKNQIWFLFNGYVVNYYPYSGWASGKSIKDGRGLKNLLKQIK